MPHSDKGITPRTIALVCEPYMLNDALFDTDAPWNHYGSCDCWIAARPVLESLGWQIHTEDVFRSRGEIPEITLLPGIARTPLRYQLGAWHGRTRPMVFLWEGPIISSQNWDMKKHRDYEALFTWSPELVDNQRYFGICGVPRKFDPNFTINRDLSKKTGLVTMIAGHKKRGSPQELYSARLDAIEWYETHQPQAFDLYGEGWNEPAIRGVGKLRRLGLMKIVTRLMPPPPRPSYRGSVPKKKPVLERYRFAISYENARDVPGYITEKIFDPFLASCVPIYWGAPDITDYVPKDCFIDFRDYMDHAKLYERLSTMTDSEYLGYLDRIEKFIRSQVDGPFGLTQFTATLIEAISRDPDAQSP